MSEQDLQILKGYTSRIIALPAEEQQLFCGLFSEVRLDKHELFAKKDRPEQQLGFLLEGVIRAYHVRPDGEYNKNFFVPYGFVCAYTSMISGMPNQIPLQALTDCRLLVADYRKVTALFDKHPLIERMARLVAEYLYINKERKELEIIMLDSKERYALLQQEYPGLENLVNQYHIASYLGISATQLSRIRAKQATGEGA